MSSNGTRPLGAIRGCAATWIVLTVCSATVMTALDAALLERKKGFLTGGFLAEDHVTSAAQLMSFMAASLLADAAVLGLFVAIGLWLCEAVRPPLRYAAVVAIAVTPLVAANVISYQLLAYLGDAFDFSLMYELVDGSASEIFAVASGPMTVPVAALTAGIAAAAFTARRLRLAAVKDAQYQPLRLRDARLPIALFIVGLALTATVSASDDVLENGLRRKPSGGMLNYLAAHLTDFDRDGYGAIGRLADPAAFDAKVFPFAVDIPGNGIDEDGAAGDLPAALPSYADAAAPPGVWTHRPDVVLIMLESFRADLVGARHRGRPVTPTLDALASRGVSAGLAYSHNGYTVQSRHHVFSGTLANLGDGTTLVDDFKANGYETAWVSGQDESFGADDLESGFRRVDVAYDARTEPHRRYSTFTTPGSLAVPYTVVVEQVEKFLASRSQTEPLFLYVNFHDTHFPYHHRDVRPLVNDVVLARHHIAPARADQLRAMYTNTVSNIDAAVGQILRLVERSRRRAPGVIVIGDHGESLFDENFLGHGYALNDAQTRIPLIAANLPIVIEEPFGQSDLRTAIRAALLRPDADVSVVQPIARVNDRKAVFQYLGNIDRPRQIARVSAAKRVVYDFRTRKARTDADGWAKLEQLAAEDRARVVELIHDWERMKLARVRRRSPVPAEGVN